MLSYALFVRGFRQLTGADLAAIVTAIGGSTAAILGGVALVRRRSADLAERERGQCEECFTWRRNARWVITLLRDLLSEHGIAEPEGIDDELGTKRPQDAEKRE